MATITITELSPVGTDLFSGSESYMLDLSEDELGSANGGAGSTSALLTTSTWACVGVAAGVAVVSFVASYAYGRWG